MRSVAPLANFLGYYMNYMFEDVRVVTVSGAGEMFENLVNITPEDVVIAFARNNNIHLSYMEVNK